MTPKNSQDNFETPEQKAPRVDDRDKYQSKYIKTAKGKETLKKARKAYDERDPERRRRQKRDYMRRKRAEDPDIWR